MSGPVDKGGGKVEFEIQLIEGDKAKVEEIKGDGDNEYLYRVTINDKSYKVKIFNEGFYQEGEAESKVKSVVRSLVDQEGFFQDAVGKEIDIERKEQGLTSTVKNIKTRTVITDSNKLGEKVISTIQKVDKVAREVLQQSREPFRQAEQAEKKPRTTEDKSKWKPTDKEIENFCQILGVNESNEIAVIKQVVKIVQQNPKSNIKEIFKKIDVLYSPRDADMFGEDEVAKFIAYCVKYNTNFYRNTPSDKIDHIGFFLNYLHDKNIKDEIFYRVYEQVEQAFKDEKNLDKLKQKIKDLSVAGWDTFGQDFSNFVDSYNLLTHLSESLYIPKEDRQQVADDPLESKEAGRAERAEIPQSILDMRSKEFYPVQRLKPKKSYGDIYRADNVARKGTDFVKEKYSGGAAEAGWNIYEGNREAKIGVMIAANSGKPGGGLYDKIYRDSRPVTNSMFTTNTQEEAVLAVSMVQECKDDVDEQRKYLDRIKDKWGMKDHSKTNGETRQGIDFRRTTEASSFNSAYVLNGRKMANISGRHGNKQIVDGKEYPVSFVFADSVNAAAKGSDRGAMTRTLNKKAAGDYDFFRKCVKTKLRCALDAMAMQGITHALVAKLSCGIYARGIVKRGESPTEENRVRHEKIKEDYPKILQEVLDEVVGPEGQKRGQYFQHVEIPDVGRSSKPRRGRG